MEVMKVLTAISFWVTIAVSALLLVVPMYASSGTLLQVNGAPVLIALSIPVLIALQPILFPKRSVRLVAALALGAFALISGFSIGFFYVPSAAIMLAAGLAEPATP